MISKLTKLARKYLDCTDKTPETHRSNKHCYTEFYGPLFSHLEKEEINLLEVGILMGCSLKLWNDFFINGNIYGVDVKLPENKTDESFKGINLIEGNAYSNTILDLFPKIKFDIIIDDGSHTANDMSKFFNLYLPYLKDNGYMICEDIQSIQLANHVIQNFEGDKNKMSIISRVHCNPSCGDDILILYKNN